MNFHFSLARHFICRKNSKKLSFTSLVAIIGITFGVASFLVVITVLNSFQEEMKLLISSSNPNLLVFAQNGISQVDGFQKSLENFLGDKLKKQNTFLYTESILTSKGKTAAVYLQGIPGENSVNASNLKKQITPTSALSSLNSYTESKNIILGEELAENLGVKEGDQVHLLNFKTPSVSGIQTINLSVAGILHVGISRYDKQFGFMSFENLRAILNSPANWASGVQINLNNPDDAIGISQELNRELPYTAVPWQNIDKGLFQQIKRDGRSIQIIVLVISFVAGCNIIITLSLTVIDRSKQIAILRSLGSTKKQIIFIFVLSGLFLGLVGSSLGVLAGYAILKLFSGLNLGDFQQFYYLEKIPVHFDFKLIFIAFSTSLLLSFVGALYPAWKATKVSPLHGLKQN